MTEAVTHDLAAERAYLGCLLNAGPDAAQGLLDAVPPGELYEPRHSEIWHAVARQHRDGKPVDPISVLARLVEGGSRVDAIYLGSCVEAVPTHASALYYAGLIRKHARTRRGIELSARLAQYAREPDEDLRDRQVAQVLADLNAHAGDLALDLRGTAEVLDWDRLLSTDYGSIELLTDPLLGYGQQISLVGTGKVGKSILCMEWALCLAAGRPFLGNHGRALRPMYVDQENPHPEIQRRLRTLGFIEPGWMRDLHYLSFPPFRPLDTPEGAADLLRQVDRLQPDVLFLDTVSRMVSGPENDSDTWLALYRLTLLPLKARQVATVRLDHFGKDASRGARGSSAKSQDVDHVWELTEQPGGLLRLRRTHTRTGIGDGILMIRRTGSSAEPGTTTHQLVPWGPAEETRWLVQQQMCTVLERDGVALDAGRPAVRHCLVENGFRVSNDTLTELVRYRKTLAEGRPIDPGDPLPGLDEE